MVADILTKGLKRGQFDKFRKQLGLHILPSYKGIYIKVFPFFTKECFYGVSLDMYSEFFELNSLTHSGGVYIKVIYS